MAGSITHLSPRAHSPVSSSSPTSALSCGPACAQIVALGDSNTAGFGVGAQQAYPAQLETLLRSPGTAAGSTTPASAAIRPPACRRLPSAAPAGTQVVILQGGYNDRLVGRQPAAIMANIEAILARLSAQRVRGVVCGFFDPGWDAVGASVAARYGAVFVPGGACYDTTYRGPDGLHMNAAGHQVVAGRLCRWCSGCWRRPGDRAERRSRGCGRPRATRCGRFAQAAPRTGDNRGEIAAPAS